jgi:hypothetical protein
MRLGIGIDTGGTYTDAVMYDFDAKEVVLAAKALTTKEDLSLGIGNAIDGLPPDLVKRAELISLSTTLATNACVEDKGGRARLLFIGVDRRVVEWVGQEYGLPNPAEIFFLRGKTDSEGRVVEEPNWDALLKHCHKWMRGASAVGIVDIDAMDNSAILEKRAKQLVSEQCGVAAVCGHELFSDLNSVKRGSSVLLNARLIPLIREVGARRIAIAPDRSANEATGGLARSGVVPVFSVGKNLPDRVCLPYPILLGRDELEVETCGNGPQRQPAGAVLPHHADRSLLGAVLQELVVQVVGAERQVAVRLRPSPFRGMPNRSRACSTPEWLATINRSISRADRRSPP